MDYTVIAQVRDEGMARIVLVALRAHGFHPLEPRHGGLPGLPSLFGPGGVAIEVPESEARDATLLAEELLRDMGRKDT